MFLVEIYSRKYVTFLYVEFSSIFSLYYVIYVYKASIFILY